MSDTINTPQDSFQFYLRKDFEDTCDLDDVISIQDRQRFVDKLTKYIYPMNPSLKDNFIKAISSVSSHFISCTGDVYVTAPITADDHTNLYRSISFIIFSTEKFWVYIRDAIFNHIFIYSSLFNPLCRKYGEKSVDTYTKKCRDGYCLSEIDLKALSHFFEVPIYVFTSDHLKKGKQPVKIQPNDVVYPKNRITSEQNKNSRSIYLHKNENPAFYQPVISFNKHYKCNKLANETNIDSAGALKLCIPKKKYLPFTERPLQNNQTSDMSKTAVLKDKRYMQTKSEQVKTIPGFINEDERQTLVNVIWRGAEYFGDLKDKLPVVESDSSTFEIKQFTRDGNDFYRCVSFLLTSREDFHSEIRSAVFQFMSDTMNAYSLNKISLKTDDQYISSYLSKQKVEKLGVSAGQIEVNATALMLGVPICVVKGKLAKQLEMYWPEQRKDNQRGLVLYYCRNQYSPVLKYSKTLNHIAVNIRQPVLKKFQKKSTEINDENKNPGVSKKINRKRKMDDKYGNTNDLSKKQDKIEIPVDNLLKDLILCTEELENPVEPLQEPFTRSELKTLKPTEDQDHNKFQCEPDLDFLSGTQPFDVNTNDTFKLDLFNDNEIREPSMTEVEDQLNQSDLGIFSTMNDAVPTPVLTDTFEDLFPLDEITFQTSPRSDELVPAQTFAISSPRREDYDNTSLLQNNSDLYSFQGDKSTNHRSYVITVKCNRTDHEGRMEYAIDTVFKRPGKQEQAFERRGEENDIKIGQKLCKQDVLRERNFVRLVKMINEIYGAEQVDADVISHLKRVIWQANIGDLLHLNLKNEAANEHKIRVIDAKKLMRPFRTTVMVKNGDGFKQLTFKYGCVAIPQNEVAFDNNFGYYHSSGVKSAQWLPIPINASIFKVQDKLKPGKTLVADSEVYVLCDKELLIIDLFRGDQQPITMVIPDSSNKNLQLARLKHSGNICILDVVQRQYCIISKGSPLLWTKLKSIDEIKMPHTNSIQYTLHTSNYLPDIVTLPALSKNSKYILCDIFASNQSRILECNEYLLLQTPMKKQMTISPIHP